MSTQISGQAASARESARKSDGKFGAQQHERADGVDLAPPGTLQTDAPLQRRSFSSGSRSAREVARMFMPDRGEDETRGDLNPPYQRGSVWTDAQRVALVKSWIIGLPIPSVVINKRLDGEWPEDENGMPAGGFTHAAVDGKQRLEAASAWFSGDLAVPASWFDPGDVEETEDTADGPYVRHTGLSVSRRRLQGTTWQLSVVESKVASLEEEAEIFVLLNSGGTEQTGADMDAARRIAAGSPARGD